MTPPARIDLVAPPFAGHLHPILGIARRLARAHEVRVLSTAGALAQIRAAGLRGHAVLDGYDAEVARVADPPRRVGSNALRLEEQLRANLALQPRLRGDLEAVWRSASPDLVIADFTLPVVGVVARSMGIAWWTTHVSPCAIETADGPPAYLGGWRPRGDLLGRVRDAVGRGLVRAFKRSVFALHRQAFTALGVERVYREDGHEEAYSDERVLALGVPELEFATRWPPAVVFVGPVLYTPPSSAPAPVLASGTKRVLVTLGTHLAWRKDAVARVARDAADALPGVEIHMSDGDSRSSRADSMGGFRRVGYVPYARDLRRYDLVVHHGGAGVMYHTLAAGRPAVVFPVDYDQFDHASRLVERGLAIRLRRLRDFRSVVARALQDTQMRAATEEFSGTVAGYSAEERVAALVGDWIAIASGSGVSEG